jgi:hypothetical protein
MIFVIFVWLSSNQFCNILDTELDILGLRRLVSQLSVDDKHFDEMRFDENLRFSQTRRADASTLAFERSTLHPPRSTNSNGMSIALASPAPAIQVHAKQSPRKISHDYFSFNYGHPLLLPI